MTRRVIGVFAVVLMLGACSQKAEAPAPAPEKPAGKTQVAPVAPAPKPAAEPAQDAAAKTTATAEEKPAAKPAATAEAKPAANTTATAEAKPTAKPAAPSPAKPAAKPPAKPAARPAATAEAKPAAAPAPAPAPAAPSPAVVAAGHAVWQKHCHLCHRDGTRTEFMHHKMPNLTTVAFHKGVTDAQLEKRITEGEGKPKPDGKTPMPAFGHKLSKQELKAVVAYVRSLRK